MDWLIIYLSLIVIVLLCAASKNETRYFLSIFAVAHAFYCVAGVIYWTQFRSGLFVGFYWNVDDLISTNVYVCCSNLIFAALIFVSGSAKGVRKFEYGCLPAPTKAIAVGDTCMAAYITILSVSLISAIFVLLVGSFGSGRPEEKGGIFLIAYQFSDMLIPLICFAVASRWRMSIIISISAFFIFYAVLVGFRYKIALLAIPLLLHLLDSEVSYYKKALAILVSLIAMVSLFSAMTLYRVKFGIPDLTKSVEASGIVYGFFAEANTIFGMAAVQYGYVEGGQHYGLQPLIDAFKEMIPRVLMPGRTSGEYVDLMRSSMISIQGSKSGTAYYWVGEFCIMFGWLGYFIGPVVMVMLFTTFKGIARSLFRNLSHRMMGIFIVTSVLAYYQFGRGYFPQIFKSYVFVIGVFYLLSWLAGRRIVVRG